MKIKPTKLINVLLALSMMLGFVQTIPVMAKGITPQATTTIGFDAPTDATTCETIEVNVVVTNVVALTGYHLEMKFDKSKLQVLEVENGGLLYDESDRLGLYEPILDKGNGTGTLLWGMAQQGVLGDPTPVTGSGDLLTITMKALKTSGTTDLEILGATMLVDWPDAQEIVYEVGGKATISLASCKPTAIALDEDEVEENKPVGTTVGTLSATDPDEDDDSFTYTLVDSTAYPDNAAFEIVSDKLNTAAVFNFEVKNTYEIKIRATDEHGAYIEKVFTITVTDVNDAPVLDPIGPQSVANTGTLTIAPTASDEDVPAPILEWSLGPGTATGATIDPETGAFSWAPGTMTAPGTYTAIICVSDGDATTCETVSITVTDGVSPIMENVSPARGNVYLADGESFVLVIDASDDNLYSLEVDHSFGPPKYQVGDALYLPEFTVYADKDNPYGSEEAEDAFETMGVSVTYDDAKHIWTIDFGEDITEDYFIPHGVTFYLVLHDEAGNTWGSMSPTSPVNTYAYTLVRDDVAPVMQVVSPERGNVYLAAGENFVLTVDASDTNLALLEIDHSMEATLPEFKVYADEDDPYGGNKAAFDTAGVTVLYDDSSQKWTIDFGPNLTNTFMANVNGITFYMVLEDLAGNKWGSMYTVEPFNTFAYKLVRDNVDPKLISVTPPHGSTVKLGIGDTFKLTIKAEDDNLRELEIDHSMETTLDEFSVYASETDPYGGDYGLFETAGVTVTYDAGTQTWVIDFGPTVSGMIANNGGITFYMVLEDMAGNTWGSMYATDEFNTFKYIVSQDLERPTIASVVAKGATGFSDVTAVGTTLTVEEDYKVSTIEITMNEPVAVAVETQVMINPQGAVYGTVTAVNGAVITVTPAVGNETASVLGTFTFTVPEGSVEDLHGNAWLNVPISLVVQDTSAPELINVTPTKGSSFLYGPGGKFVLTVEAKDDNLYSLEVDHSMQDTLPEFTVYASVANPYGDEATKALFEGQGVFVTYNATTQTWTIDFGAAITTQFANNGGITFYLVLADESGNKWGSMDPVKPVNTFNYTIAQDVDAPTVSGAIAIGADGFADVDAVEMVITVNQGYKVAKTEVTLNEAVTLLDGTVVSLDNAAYGSITLDSTGKILTVTPYPGNEEASRVGEFIFTIPDGSVKDLAGNALKTLSLKLIVLNVAPVAVDDAYTVNEDETLTVVVPGVLANDTDYPGTTLTAEWVSGPSNGTLTLSADGSFVYTPTANFHGTDTFTYTANDGDMDSNIATVTIAVTPVNDAPVAQDQTVTTLEDTAKEITLVATDADGDTLIYTVLAGPTNGSLSGTAPNLTYTPNANFNGTDTFTFKANDGTIDSNTATVSISITPVNDAPVAQDQTVTTLEDTAKEITLVATDADGDTLIYTVLAGPTNGSLSGTAPNLTYTPNANFNGTDEFTFKAHDGSVDSNDATVTINITPVNDAPVAVDDSYTMLEDGTLTIAAPGILENDLDDGSSLTAILVDDVSHGELTLNANGSFTYTPDAHFNGKDSFTYKASDGESLSNLAVVEITVTPVNDWVVANDDAYETLMNVNLVVEAEDGILANDVLLDPNETVSIEILRAPESGTLVMNNDGSFTYVPKQGFWGTVTFEYRVRSEQKGEFFDDAIVTILVKPHGLIYLPLMFK